MKIKILIFFILLSAFYQNAQAGWPQVVEPPQATKYKMAEEVFVNGIEIDVTHFTSRLSAQQVLSFYRNRWDKYAESESGVWQQISQMQNKYFITVQVQDNVDSGSNGRINIIELSKRKPEKVGKDIPLMQGTKILNEVITKDKLNVSTMLLLVNNFTVDENAEFYESYYSDNEWKTVTHQNTGKGGIVLVFKKVSDETTITIKSIKSASTIVMNQVKKRSWFN